ncbi:MULTISPECIES: sulfatase [unclassified Lentimonas]|uniref:sulfatase n=1 Tax=unclassified Lentimonas TaxID=2630993 RepID=UPI001329967A|nr:MULTISPECIES: sulfatase [unclassified Lentimonas]CAA6689476.1 Choline-sulfatase (EC [Lentimonas sp. CC10]CAA6692007.1 Choline-sulfatase (EC [Lentimonas sp. CC19]CAA7070532.1 Choline-sulfatase (EC [Lentimonas sp. CC11]
MHSFHLRLTIRRLLLIGTCLLSVLFCTQALQAQQKNIMFIVIDDLDMALSAYGNTTTLTPNIDRLAAEGLVFDRAYTSGTICSTSRNSFLAGQRLTIGNSLRDVFPDIVSLPQHFRENGYQTAGVGKIYHDEEDTDARAFDFWVNHEYDGDIQGIGAYQIQSIEEQAGGEADHIITRPGRNDDDSQYMDGMNFLELEDYVLNQLDPTQPFFISYGIHKPHSGLTCPSRYYDMYAAPDANGKLQPGDRDDITLPYVPSDWIKPNEWCLNGKNGATYTESDWRYLHQAYYACVTWADQLVGQALDLLESRGLLDDTLIVLTSDHGFHLGSHEHLLKHTLFNKTAQVPFIVRLPGQVAAGARTNSMVELIDLYPTFIDWAGLPEPEHPLEGKSIVSLFSEPDAETNYHAFLFRTDKDRDTGVRALGERVRTDEYSYIRYTLLGNTIPSEFERTYYQLYNATSDPDEYVNLAYKPEYAGLLSELDQVLDTRDSTPDIGVDTSPDAGGPIATEGFESQDLAATQETVSPSAWTEAGWTVVDADDAQVITFNGPEVGSAHALVRRDGSLERGIQLGGYDSATIVFTVKAKNYSGSESAVLEFYNGSELVESQTIITAADTVEFSPIIVSVVFPAAALTDDCRIRFASFGGGAGDSMFIDAIEVYGAPVAGWEVSDLGEIAVPSTFNYDDAAGILTVDTNTLGTNNAGDSIALMSIEQQGDRVMTAQLGDFTVGKGSARAGLLVRANLVDAEAPYFGVFEKKNGRIVFEYRRETDVSLTRAEFDVGSVNTTLQVERIGDEFVARYKLNGLGDWIEAGRYTFAGTVPTSAFWAVAASSNRTDSNVVVTVSDIEVAE